MSFFYVPVPLTDIGDTAINKNISDLEKLIPSRKDRYKKIFFDTTVSASIAAAAAKSRQSCLTLCDPIDGSPPGSPVPGILQARTLEWVAIAFSNA